MDLQTIRIPSHDLEIIRVAGEFDYPWHCHTTHWVFGVVVSGDCTVVTAESILHPRWFSLPPLTGHEVHLGPDTMLVTVTIEDQAVREADPKILLDTIHSALDKADCDADTVVSALSQALASVESSPEPTSSRWVTLLLDKLADGANPTLPSLAAELRLSSSHLNRVCASQTGLTPHRLRMQYRLRRAQAYLTDGVAPAEAASRAGFYDQSHLNRAFRRSVGPTPVAYSEAITVVGSTP